MILSHEKIKEIKDSAEINRLFHQAKEFRLQGKQPIDLMLGNPYDTLPDFFYTAMQDTINDCSQSKKNPHSYLDSRGLPTFRNRVAEDLQLRSSLAYSADDILAIAGCANGLDVVLASLIEDGDEIIYFVPGFLEYHRYIKLNRGKAVTVPLSMDFSIDYNALEKAINLSTRAILINYPNNPCGHILRPDESQQLADFLRFKSQSIGREIIVIEDSPYDQIVYRDYFRIFSEFYEQSIYLTSMSKSHSLAGERIGYIAVHPQLCKQEERSYFLTLLSNMIRCRIINAPSFIQQVLVKTGTQAFIDKTMYESRVRLFEQACLESGFHLRPADGSFYVFAEIPNRFSTIDDWQSAAFAGEDPLLAIPGMAFGDSRFHRYLRFSLTSSDTELQRAIKKMKHICLSQ